LTIRARVQSDLLALREQYLPGLSQISESKTNDYRFRGVAPRSEVMAAMARLVEDLNYGNFKDQVAKVQGKARAHLYHDVWSVLYKLQAEPGKYNTASGVAVKPVGPIDHPQRDEHGRRVSIKHPSMPTPLSTWSDAGAVACVVPGGQMPDELHGITFAACLNAPIQPSGWEAMTEQHPLDEPAFDAPPGYKKAAGVVICEPDGRVWLVAPSNGFGGYKATFPKGTMDGKSAQATALVEALEESGLRVRLMRHLVDVKRSQSYTRYYLAERIGGNPADMGWESQAVLLVPRKDLARFLESPYDQLIVKALSGHGR
jgi:8-oxo-dGTP pyrophosphatase MutT (NUDIX family)